MGGDRARLPEVPDAPYTAVCGCLSVHTLWAPFSELFIHFLCSKLCCSGEAAAQLVPLGQMEENRCVLGMRMAVLMVGGQILFKVDTC